MINRLPVDSRARHYPPSEMLDGDSSSDVYQNTRGPRVSKRKTDIVREALSRSLSRAKPPRVI